MKRERSPSGQITDMQAKMAEYQDNGVHLGWLMAPMEQQLLVHRPHCTVERLHHPFEISGAPELPGFTLDLQEIWQPGF